MADESSVAQDVAARAFMALDRCAAYGPGFTSVEGTQSCVKIGGHLRVEIQSGTAARATSDWSEGGTAPTALRTEAPLGSDASDDTSARHLRLPQDSLPQDGGTSIDGTYLR